jgi:hypothetical protein
MAKNLLQMLALLGLMVMYIGMANYPTFGLNKNPSNRLHSRNWLFLRIGYFQKIEYFKK